VLPQETEAFGRPWLCLTWESAHGTMASEGSIPGEQRLVLVPGAAIDDLPARRAEHVDKRCHACAEPLVTSVIPPEEDMPWVCYV
jgi:hypothetical protein